MSSEADRQMHAETKRGPPIVARISLGILGFALTVVCVDILVSFLALTPCPVLSTATDLVLTILAVSLTLLPLPRAELEKKVALVGQGLVVAILAWMVGNLLYIPRPAKADYSPLAIDRFKLRSLLFPRVDEEGLAAARDLWLGRIYVKERLGDGRLVVWSDGPDGDNDHAERPVGREALRFERGFARWHFGGHLPWQPLLKRAAYWEVIKLWGHLDGDVVLVLQEDMGVFVK